MPLRTASLAAVVAGLVATTLAGCSGEDDEGDAAPDGRLGEARGMLPASTTTLEFVDRAASAERAGIGGEVTLDEYFEALTLSQLAESPLAPTIIAADEAGVALDERDVEWSATATFDTADGGATVTVYRVSDGVDLEAMVAELVSAGLSAEDSDGRTRLVGDPARVVTDGELGTTVAGGYPPSFTDVTVDEDEALVVTGSGAADVLEVVDGDAPGLDDGPLAELLDDLGAEEAEQVLGFAPPNCEAALGPRATEEQRARLEAELSGLGEPVASVFARGPAGQQALLRMPDDETADADADARATYLAEGRLAGTGQPVADVLDIGSVTHDGSTVVVEAAVAEDTPVDTFEELALAADGPFACL